MRRRSSRQGVPHSAHEGHADSALVLDAPSVEVVGFPVEWQTRPMIWWNVASLVVGILGAVAGVSAAIWVFRRETALRAKEQAQAQQRTEEERKEARVAQAKTEAAVEARQAREAKRLKYEADYREFRSLIEEIRESTYAVLISGLATREDLEAKGWDSLDDRLDRVGNRVPALYLPAVNLMHVVSMVKFHALPERTDKILRNAIWNGVSQYIAAKEAQEAANQALKKLDREWDG